ncbi:protein phosphatase 1 regulatory subunit 3E [Danio rerio]|uniref:Protein phosphatase 1 regulatory subunit 3E n=1 Tax=Danio rerio TaxID=7955 RepID=A0A8M2B645_DANRE|nr:protein phosphatase 1 regulatory subunit 3E-like [Danio rerio]|eukprot:XP_005159256.1 protein phosphatase 1 regulatory subunit 3E-like [Danio rerio]
MEAETVVMLPPKNCIPRNYSCIAGLFGSLATEQKLEDGEDDMEEDEVKNGDCEALQINVVNTKPRGRESFLKPPHSPTQRRRCKSLPTSAERAKLEIARSRSPSSQKKVRFADSLGLDLISVKHFDDTDMPEVPDRIIDRFKKARAFHLNNFDNTSSQSVFMELLFTNPGCLPDFQDRVSAGKVLLESVHADEFCISGVVRVLNLAFEKSVYLRYTLNNWTSYTDILAFYIPHSNDGETDQFSFKIITPTFLEFGGTLQFAIKYCVGGCEFWDNNSGNNYKVRRHRFKISPPREWENGWIHFI